MKCGFIAGEAERSGLPSPWLPQPRPGSAARHPARGHPTQSSFPSPKASSMAGHLGPIPPCTSRPPQLPQGSCVNHPPLQSSHDAAGMENQNRGVGAAVPSQQHQHPPAFPPVPPVQAQGTATPPAPGAARAGRPLQPAALGMKLEPPLSKTQSYWVVGNGAAEQEGQGMSHRANAPAVRARGTCKTPPPWHRWPLHLQRLPPEGPEVLQEGKAPLSQSVLRPRAALSGRSLCRP